MMKATTDKILLEKDVDLIAKIAAGDRQAFSQLVLQNQDRVVNLAFRILGDRAAAEDIAQDAFLRAYHSADRFRGGASVQTWLYRITVNLALKHLRKRKWERLFSFLEAEEINRWQTELNQRPDRLAETEEAKQLLHQAVLQLPEAQRTVLILHRWEGLSHKEIADIMGLSVSAVESRLHRAYKKLATILARWMK